MIQCSECESPQYLRITRGEIDIQDGMIAEVEERYKCYYCGHTGYYWFLAGTEQYSGIAESTAEKPNPHH